MNGYRISIIDSLEQWEELRIEWNTLLEQTVAPNIFLTWEWLYSWAQCFVNGTRKLFILVVHKGNEVVGIAPWYQNHISKGFLSSCQIEFLGTPEAGSDYLDVLIRKGREKEVTHFIYEFLLGDAAACWDRLLLHDVPSNSLFLMHLLNRIKEDGKYVAMEAVSFCPVVCLPRTEDEFLASLSSNRRELFRRHWKILRKKNNVEHLTFSTANIEKPLDDFFALYTEKAGWPSVDLHRFLARFIEKKGTGSVQIDFLATSAGYIGGLLHFRYKNTLYMYLMAIDKTYSLRVSTGNVLVGLCILNAVRESVSYYDFLKGSEDYKFHWANYAKSSNKVLFQRRSPVPVCLALAEIAKSAAKLILR